MRDQRDAGRPEAGIGFGTGDFLAEFRGEFAMHDRDIDPDLLEDAALQERRRATAATRTLPVLALEARARRTRKFVLDRFEFAANAVGERGEPVGGALSAVFVLGHHHDPAGGSPGSWPGSWFVWRSAS